MSRVHVTRKTGPFTAWAALLLGGWLACLTPGCGGSGEAATPSGAPAAEAVEAEEAQDAIAVKVREVAEEPLSSVYATSATLRADRRAVVKARTASVIRRLLVEEGDLVNQGQTLAVLEDDEQQIEHQRTSSVRDTRMREYERAKRLHEQQLMSEEEYETIRRQWEESVHTAALAQLLLARTVIRAPFNGAILKRYLDVGATVSDGSDVYDLADLSPLYADVNVPEQQVARLGTGQRVRLLTDPAGGTTAARIERIAPAVDAATGTVKVTLAVDESARLRPGSFVRVEIVTDTHADALVVPRSALVAEGRRWHVFRVSDEGKVERLEVARGYEEGDKVEVLDSGGGRMLAPGDRVVVVGASALTDGASVEVVEPSASESDRGAASTPGRDRVAA